MNKVNIVVGDQAASALRAAFEEIEKAEEDIFVIKDVFSVGPLRSEEMPFSQLRSSFWQEVANDESIQADDLERLMELSTKITNDEVDEVCLWMSGLPADVCSYYFLLHFLKKHMGKLFVININGLPFLDEEGKLYFPAGISSLPPKQVLKAMKLKRVINPAEWETDGDEWKRLIHEAHQGVRINTGGKSIACKDIDFFDKSLVELATNTNQKVAKLIGNAITKHKIYTGDTFLIWRLKQLAYGGKLTLSKDSVKLFNGVAEEVELFDDTDESASSQKEND